MKDWDAYIGEVYGRLVIQSVYRKNGITYCTCECECGNIKDIALYAVTHGITKSCGCLSAELSRNRRFNDLTNQKFGKLTVMYYNEEIKKWHCSCECGNEKDISAINLTKGLTKSCGCLRGHKSKKENVVKQKKPKLEHPNAVWLKGQKFNRLFVLEDCFMEGRHYCKCRCDCGNIKYIVASKVKSGATKSCGCYRHRAVAPLEIGNVYGKLTIVSSPVYKNNKYFYDCKCECGNIVSVWHGNLVSGNSQSCGCTDIAHRGSQDELDIKEYIENIFNKKFAKVKILDGLEIDLYNDELKLGIEYNGSAFHATKNGVYGNKDKYYHRDKFLLAKEKGIHLINIFDVDWKNNKEKIKTYLDSLCSDKVIYARKTTVSKIDNITAKEFLTKYHLQGWYLLCSINYGLYYNDELVAVMSFGKLRLHNTEEGQYELHRYCCKADYRIVGGASKLFKHFIDAYLPKYIRSYSDNDYFLGSVYKELGFMYSGQVNPRYYWYYGNKELKRERCQLAKLKEIYSDLYDEAISVSATNKEDYIMLKLGARKVYRSGNTKWEWNVSE